ncbi:P-loop containing nucleoside triphosphate hydrolase protein [Suillus subluteus]|nr:P-loop containing nucleoside triphosphate hydrolase protein [Suillus subluteus]
MQKERPVKARAGEFDHQDTRRFKHTRVGIWDLYEERQSDLSRIPTSSISETYTRIIQNVPLLVRMLKDVLSIKRCPMLLFAYLVVEVLASLIPAVSLWYSGQLLRLVESTMETRTVDTTVLVHFAVAHLICTVALRFLRYSRACVTSPLNLYIKQFYHERMFYATVCLDLPAFQTLQGLRMHELDFGLNGWYTSSIWHTINTSTNIAMMHIRLLSQLLVLITVMWEQQDGLLLVILSFLQYILPWDSMGKAVVGSLVWAARTTNEDFIRMRGLREFITGSSHSQELIAGNLSEHISARFHESAQRLGKDAAEFSELKRYRSFKECLSIAFILQETMHVLPQIVFTLRVVKNPMTTPFYLASLVLIKQVFNPSGNKGFSTSEMLSTLAAHLSTTHDMYEIENIRNLVVDGTEPFPEIQQSLASGISVEFRNVSFRYLGADRCALRDVSFKIGAGQLCVVVGVNGSGKSTILKLISRIYDPTEGTILIDGRDIKTFRLADLRATMSILFQDYTQFPLSMRENIGLGNPALAHDDDKVREAARLGGAEDFIDELPHGFNTYLDPHINGYYGDLPEGTTTLFGQPVDSSSQKFFDNVHISRAGLQISRGQVQRLAISRTFMRSLVSETESSAGMLLFDEPSASLDPTAEHDLFERLRKLRGNKTMIFSTHRFGNLTQHADLILYIDETVQEAGTHHELMKKGGEYARIWNLQAKPFI